MTGTDPLADAARAATEAGHAPVMPGQAVGALLDGGSPELMAGVWLDGTMGAGGYSRAILARVAPAGGRLIALDRDPSAHAAAGAWAPEWGDALVLIDGAFSSLDLHAAAAGAEKLSGVVMDIGVSSMQIDQDLRGFSFMRDGPLDMRMAAHGPTAADLVATASEEELAAILYHYGDERASRRIARAIIETRKLAPIETTSQLARIVASKLPRPKPGQINPATRSFQAIRIAVNDELGELVRGLCAAERALAPEGRLSVVTFHSLEDRIVKRFMQMRSADAPTGSRHAPVTATAEPAFRRLTRKALTASEDEIAANPRARSAHLRAAIRTEAPADPRDPMDRDVLRELGAPDIPALQAPLTRLWDRRSG
jgi:16S rRNA (cytosine1402-N4)-methyltransferase